MRIRCEKSIYRGLIEDCSGGLLPEWDVHSARLRDFKLLSVGGLMDKVQDVLN